MISVSQAYKNLTQSNIRPKCEPKIKLSGKDEQGADINFVWDAKNLKSFSYKRGIDPVGRELPFMELTWTEMYSGKLDEELFPEKYNNIGKYMKVVLEFHQNLSFFNTWKTIFDKSLSWADLFSKNWKQVKNEVEKEVIVFPTLFLTARPTYNKQTISWKAVDILSFLEENQTKGFVAESPFLNPIKYLLINEKGNFSKSEDIVECISKSENNLVGDYGTIGYNVIFDGNTKRIITEYLQLRNLYLDFEQDGSFVTKGFYYRTQNGAFTKKTLRNFPEIQKNPNISSYTFKSYSLVENPDKTYTKTPVLYKQFRGANIYKVDYDGYGEVESGGFALSLTHQLTSKTDPVSIIPVNWQSSDNVFVGDARGEVLSENISMNPYDSNSEYMRSRYDYLKSYFNNSSSLNFSCLPDLSVTTGDVCSVETSLYKGANTITKECMVVGVELKYSGTVKQSLIVHGFEK